MSFRIGQGYDVHRLKEGRALILGGVTIPYEKGLDGHSDADVLSHALVDAMLGAAALGDIGTHFPDNDNRFKGISGMTLLAQTRALITAAGYKIVNLDAVVVAEQPKLAPYKMDMIRHIAAALQIPEQDINLKAKTEEGLGFTGLGEGMAAHAVCLLETCHCYPAPSQEDDL